ncbi:hypothetical protein T484DRAFT_1857760 [Baffinella frigidus]|nr:hypothetical protein T484DRAFT_1857760 [Cryptophyta sp. CCMP2293]
MFARGGARRVVGAVALSLATCLVALVCLHSSHSGVELLGRPQALVGDAMLDDPSLVFGSTKAATQQLAGVSQASARYAARWENQAQSELNAYSDISSNILAVPKKERAAPETEQRTERKMSLKEELADARAHNQELNTYKDILGPMKVLPNPNP